MKLRILSLAIFGSGSTLAACAPNPYVLQDRVYGTYPPVAALPTPMPNRPATPNVSPTRPKPPITRPLPQEPAVTVVTPPVRPTEESVTPPPAPPPRKVSPAVRALQQQAEREAASGNLDKAADTLERALRIEPRNPDLWLQLSEIKRRQGNLEQASQMAAKARSYQE